MAKYLVEHKADCPTCDDDSCPECEDGSLEWPSFQVEAQGPCSACDMEGPVCAFGDDDTHLCIRCYLLVHRADCGCNLWRKAEEEVLWTEAEMLKARQVSRQINTLVR